MNFEQYITESKTNAHNIKHEILQKIKLTMLIVFGNFGNMYNETWRRQSIVGNTRESN